MPRMGRRKGCRGWRLQSNTLDRQGYGLGVWIVPGGGTGYLSVLERITAPRGCWNTVIWFWGDGHLRGGLCVSIAEEWVIR